MYQCLILTRWASLIPFSHQQVPAKVNNIKVKTCKSCKYLNDAENLFVIVIVLALFLLLETLDPVVLAEPFKGQSQEIRYNGRLRHWCFHMKTNLYSSTQLNSLSDAVNHYSPKMNNNEQSEQLKVEIAGVKAAAEAKEATNIAEHSKLDTQARCWNKS